MKKRLLSMLMVVLMVVALLPSAAFAAGSSFTKVTDADGKTVEAKTVITITKDAAAKTPGVNAEVDWVTGKVVSYKITPFAPLLRSITQKEYVWLETVLAEFCA